MPGTAGGGSNSNVTGRWDIQKRGNNAILVYVTDKSKQGSFQIYLQNNGRVNIGGDAFAVQ